MLSHKCSRRVPGYFALIDDKAPPAARNSKEVARTPKTTLLSSLRKWWAQLVMKPWMLPGPRHRELTIMRTTRRAVVAIRAAV